LEIRSGVLSTSPHVIIGTFSGSGDGALFKLYFSYSKLNLFLFLSSYLPDSIGVDGIYYKFGFL